MGGNDSDSNREGGSPYHMTTSLHGSLLLLPCWIAFTIPPPFPFYNTSDHRPSTQGQGPNFLVSCLQCGQSRERSGAFADSFTLQKGRSLAAPLHSAPAFFLFLTVQQTEQYCPSTAVDKSSCFHLCFMLISPKFKIMRE